MLVFIVILTTLFELHFFLKPQTSSNFENFFLKAPHNKFLALKTYEAVRCMSVSQLKVFYI